jgi:HK97 family phage major capsid protein
VNEIEKLQKRIAEIDARRKVLVGNDEHIMSAEELAEDDQLVIERKECVAKLDESQRAIAESDRRRIEARNAKAPVSPRRAGTMQPGAPRVDQDPHIEVRAPEKFTSLGQQLQAIAQAGMTGQEDNRLVWQSIVPHAVVSGAGSGIPSDGGYLIQKDIQTELMSKVYATGDVLSRCKKVNIGPGSDGLVMNMIDETSRATGSRWGGVQVYWGAEADSATAKKPKFRQEKWELKELIGLAYITDRLLADATAMESVFSQAFTSEIQFVAEDAVFNGVAPGQMQGILLAPCVVSVAKETGQGAATFVYENALKMWSRMYAPSRANSAWFINQDVEPQLHQMSIPVGTGGQPVYLPPGGLSQTPYASLFGRPVIPTEYNPTLGTTGDVVLADLSQYLVIEKGGVQSDSSIHVRFANNEKTFRWIYRLDGKPLWNSALTPAKGSATKGPFVKLDTRA